MQAFDDAADGERFLDDGAEVGTGTFAAVAERQLDAIETLVNEVLLQRLVVLEVLLGTCRA
jgi:hypothetical protein